MIEVAARTLKILLVEDNPGDVFLTREALDLLDESYVMDVARDGVEAMGLLHLKAQAYDVIILDMNLPRKTGREVLSEMSADQLLRRIPVAILTTASPERDVCGDFPDITCLFQLKSSDFDDLVETARRIYTFGVEHRKG